MFSFNDLITPLTREQVQASIYNVLAIVGVNTTSWKPGAVVRTMIAGTSLVLAAFSTLMADIARSGFLELATGPWLTFLARYVYGVERVEASFASGFVTLVNGGGGSFTVDAYDLTVSNPVTGKTYRNSEPFALPPLGTTIVPIVAVEAGSASTSVPGTITELETTLLGVSCANAAAVVGLDAEMDPQLRTRCYEQLGALSPMGPWDAYSSAARNAKRADGASVGVTRARVVNDGLGYGVVTTYVATASGQVAGASDDPSTDLGAIHAAILRNAAPQTATANTVSASPVGVSVSYQAWLYNTSGLTEQQIKDAIESKLTAFMSSQPIGGHRVSGAGRVYVDAIKTVIGSALPQIFHVVVTLPAADIRLAISDVPVLGTPNGTIHQVPPEGIA